MNYRKRLNDISGNKYVAPCLVLLICFIHAYPFLAGYRLSADDVAYHLYAMNGVAESWQFIKNTAIDQGRIVHFPDLVTSLIGSYFADSTLFRAFYVALYFANFGLFAFYISRLCKVKAAWFFFLVLLVLHPLDYFHLSPGAYPFKISFPVFLILISRIAMLIIRSRGSFDQVKEIPWVVLCFFAMMFSEYAFAFALSLMIAEFATRVIAFGNAGSNSWFVAAVKNIPSHQTRQDLFLVVLFVFLYVGFRLVFPSSYDGNRLPESLNVLLFLKAMTGHIVGGTVFSSFSRYSDLKFYFEIRYSGFDYFLLFMLFMATLLSARLLLSEFFKNAQSSRIQVNIKSALIISLSVALIVTAPVAITQKYQSWCNELDTCVFLDSSLSYLGFGSFLGAGFLLLASMPGQNRSFGIYVLSGILAFIGAAAQINNLRLAASMSEYVSGWERAKILSCSPDSYISSFPDLNRLIEPIPRIRFHPEFDISNYWRRYLADQKRRTGCDPADPLYMGPFADILAGDMNFSNSGEGQKYLTRGWSAPERWGIWSDGDRAEVLLPLKSYHQTLLMTVSAFVSEAQPVQRFSIVVNGVHIHDAELTNATGNHIRLDLTEALGQGHPLPMFSVMQFEFKDAVSPFQLGLSVDSRALAIGLTSLEVR